jgi:hypothetical protein
MQELHRTPPPSPSKGSEPYGILAVCRINLWPAVRMELGQEGWLQQPVDKVRGPIVAGDQGSRRDHQCTTTTTSQTFYFRFCILYTYLQF